MKWWGWAIVAALVFTVIALVAVIFHWTPLWAIMSITALLLCIAGLIGLMIAMAPKW
jgi:hypothetical protein